MKILITGGASGLGKAIVEKLAAKKENLIYFTYNSSSESAIALQDQYPNTQSIQLDFRSEESIGSFLLQIPELAPDALVNNALNGFTQIHFHKFDSLTFENSFKVNVYPVLKIAQKFIEISRKRKAGKIVTILTSAIINRPPVGFSEYVANKAYLHSMAKSWAVENAAFGITSNCISPSLMLTRLMSNLDKRVIENMTREMGGKALLSEKEVAEAVEFLLDASSHINGSNLIINDANDIL
jgi:NAD(P)-dependent dehydrogenase (short-subunit alcohol dehydrogenase family)